MKIKIYYNPEDLNKKGVYKMIIDSKHVLIGYTARSYKKRWFEHLKTILYQKHNRNVTAAIKNAQVIEFYLIKTFKTEAGARRFEREQIMLMQPDLNVQKKFHVK